jgi:hypothetical protein
VGLLRRTAEQLTGYLHRWNTSLRVPAILRDHWRGLEPQVSAITEQLEVGEWPDPLLVQIELQTGIAPEGQMHWCVSSVFPSQDLLIYRDREWPYDRVRPEDIPQHLPTLWEGYLQVHLEAHDQHLWIDIPLNPVPWCQPRAVWTRYLKPLAKQEKRPLRKAEQDWLALAHTPLPSLGQRAWVVHAYNETVMEELLTNLVIIAEREGFPISEDDSCAAWKWIRQVIRSSVRGTQDHQEIEALVSKVYQDLVSKFDLPGTDWSLRTFIQKTARGYKLDERKKLITEVPLEPFLYPVTGETMYSDAWVAQDIDRHKKTVKRWKADHGITRKGCSETELVAIRQEYAPKKERKRRWEKGKACGMSDDSLKKLFQRKKKPDGTPDLEAIDAHIKRREKKAEETAPSENTISIEDQIAEWEARLAEAELGSDEWCVARDAVGQLQRRQAGAQP